MTIGTQTMIYAPQVRVLVSTSDGVLDLSDDITTGQVRRVMNGLSTFSCVLSNRDRKYIGAMKRMDRVVVWFKRISWIQVFAGYLDSVPGMGLYVNTVQIRASCTLKRIQNTYWDPLLPDSQALLDQFKNVNSASGHSSDQGLGAMLADLMIKVGGWSRESIKVQNIPSGFLDLGFKIAQAEYDQALIDQWRKSLGFTPTTGVVATANPIQAQKTVVQPPNGTTYGMDDIVTICRAAGFTGDSLQTAAAIVMDVSGGNPKLTTSTGPKNEAAVGLFQIDPSANPVLFLSNVELEDPLVNAQQAYTQISSAGSDFSYWASFLSKSYEKFLASAKFYSLMPDTKIISVTLAPVNATTNTGTSVSAAQNGSVTKTESSNPTAGNLAPGVSAITIPKYPANATTEYLKGIYGKTAAEVSANVITISFQGISIQVHKYASAAFLAVDAALTAANSTYVVKTVDTLVGKDSNVAGHDTPTWHSYAIAADINIANNIGNSSIPKDFISAFTQNNFVWGGDWGDFGHFQWQGGGVYTGNVGAAGVAQGAPNTLTQANVFENGVFNYLYYGETQDPGLSITLRGDKAPANDQQLLSTVQAITSSSLRSFMSAPNGDFVAFYPDRFGLNGKKINFHLQDIELVDFSIDVNDDSMATDVFVAGGTNHEVGSPSIDVGVWLNSTGVVNIRQKATMALLLGIDIDTDPDYNPDVFYKRFGLRPLKAEYPQVSASIMESLQALSLFQQKWGEQYSTGMQLTFMPELYPGMRVEIISHSVVVFVEDVTHSFGYDTGFTTSATISSPSSTVTNGGVRGLPLAKL